MMGDVRLPWTVEDLEADWARRRAEIAARMGALADWRRPSRRWSRWPLCALRRHPVMPGAYCACRRVLAFRIESEASPT